MIKLFCILSILCLSCNSDKELVGEYISYKPSKFYNLWHTNDLKRRYVLGSSLLLKMDSSFIQTTCGNIINGTWDTNGDTLYLHCESNKWAIDSFNKLGFKGMFPICSEQPDKYLIISDHLINLDTVYYQNEYIFFDDLKKK